MAERERTVPPLAEPCWFFPAAHVEPLPAPQVEVFLRQLGEEDRRLLVLVHGLRLELGGVARALRLDPSIVSWRVRRALERGAAGGDPAALERGLAELLARRGGAAASRAAELAAQFPADVRARIAERLTDELDERAAAGGGKTGLGIGSLALILIAVAGFLVYGAIRDVNPLWRGEAYARQQNFPEARRWLQEAGGLQEARAWIAITWLAEGQFDKALEVLGEPGVAQFFGDFQPVEGPLQLVEGDAASAALLPRGVITEPRPTFVYRAGPAGALGVELQSLGRLGGRSLTQTIAVPDTSGGKPIAEASYPADWPVLGDCSVLWTAPGTDAGSATFTVLSRDERREIMNKADMQLNKSIPAPARDFLRAHFYLRNKLYAQAGVLFARISREFPDQEYPHRKLAEIGAALAVDPSVFLR